MRAKRWAAWGLALALLLGALPGSALAAESAAGEDLSAVSAADTVSEEPEMAEAVPEPEASAPTEQAAVREENSAQENGAEEAPEADGEPEASAPTERAAVREENGAEENGPEEAPEADGEPEAEQAGAGTVTGFLHSGPVTELAVEQAQRPGLEELVSRLPKQLTVLVNGRQGSIPVEWYCVGEDYEAGDSYYYQFSPRWDQNRWPLAAGLNVAEEAPYAAVFVTESALSPQSAETVELECYRFFTETMGLNSAAACGILANIYNECAFKPNNLQQVFEKKLGFTDESYTEAVDKGTYTNFVKDSAGYGLVQFTWWEYKRDLLAYAKKKGKSIGDTQMQLEYLQISLGAGRIKKLKAFPNTAQGAYDAGKYFCDSYERPGLKEQPVARGRLARDRFWPKYKDAFAQAETGVTDALAAPELVSLTQSSRGLKLSYNGVPGASKYRVFRDEGAGWVKLGDTTDFSWTDESLTSGKTYTYTVCCLNSSGKQVSGHITPGLSRCFWAAPAVKTRNNQNGGIRVDWKSQSAPAYLLYRKLYGGQWETPVLMTGTTYLDTAVKGGQWYYYAVRCADENGVPLSGYLASERVVYLTAPRLRGAVNTAKGIQVSWSGSAGAAGYAVFRKSGSSGWQKLTTVKGAKTLRYLDQSAKTKNGTTYRYTVRAVRGENLSGYYAEGAVCCRLTAPKLSQVSTGKGGRLSVRWKKNAKAQGYQVQLTQGKTQKRALVEGSGSLRYARKGLKKGRYQVSVRAWRKLNGRYCCSAWSEAQSVKY